MATQVILLERIEKLGEMGDVVAVKPGYARNFLLPQKKALRANDQNVAYFEAQKKHIQAESDKKKKAAEAVAKKLEGLKVPLVRQASEAGQLYGSVTSQDIASEVSEASKEKIGRSAVQLNQNFKMIGLFPVAITLHPEVKVEVTINIARSLEEADIQAKTGKALVSDDSAQAEETAKAPEEAVDEKQLEEVLEDSALEAEKEKAAAEKAKAEEEAQKAETDSKEADQTEAEKSEETSQEDSKEEDTKE